MILWRPLRTLLWYVLQAGFRHFISDEIQIDGTIGKGIAGDEILPTWGSLGIRLVFDWFKKKE